MMPLKITNKMTNGSSKTSTSKSVTKNEAVRAFKYSVCVLMCGKKSTVKADKCIAEEGGCNSYKVFNYKINNNEDKTTK